MLICLSIFFSRYICNILHLENYQSCVRSFSLQLNDKVWFLRKQFSVEVYQSENFSSTLPINGPWVNLYIQGVQKCATLRGGGSTRHNWDRAGSNLGSITSCQKIADRHVHENEYIISFGVASDQEIIQKLYLFINQDCQYIKIYLFCI